MEVAIFADQMTRDLMGFSMPWCLWAFALIAMVGVLGVRNIELNAYVLGISISLEIVILLIFKVGPMGRTGNIPGRFPLFDFSFPFGAAYALLVLSNIIYNNFGADGVGIQFFFVSPVRF